MLTFLKNEKLSVSISSVGAELKSIKYKGEEKLWNGDERFWSGQAPVLFPICGRLKENRYTYEGKEYFLAQHGFAREKEFLTEYAGEEKAVFLLKSDDETKKQFPFEFELRITYTLIENAVKIDYSVKNCGENTMYFSIGAHEAHACPSGIEDYSVIFEKKEKFESTLPCGRFLAHEKETISEEGTELKLKYKYFNTDALVFTDLKSRKAILKNNVTGAGTELDFNGFDYFLLWTKPQAGYICLEPWCGLHDYADDNYDITKKAGINKVEPGCEFARTHTIKYCV